MICCEEMNYVDYFALIKNIKHYKPHRKFLIHVVCYRDSQLINKKCITAIQIQYFKLYFSIKNHMQSNKLPIFTFNNIYLSKWIYKNVGGLNFPLQILTWIILSLLLLNMSSEINIPILISTTVLYKYSGPNTFSI